METLIKRKGSFPLMAKKTVNKFFDDFITKDFDWSEKKFSASESKQPAVNLKETGNAIAVKLTAAEMNTEDFKIEIGNDLLLNSSENEVRKNDNLARKEFNYRSFCRLPNL
jgi:HSP20 family molecular chaperone IbpA